MIEFLLRLAKMLLMLAPFFILCWRNTKANLKRGERHKQFLMPVFAVVYCVIAVLLLTQIYDLAVMVLEKIGGWFGAGAEKLEEILPSVLHFIPQALRMLAGWLTSILEALNLQYWAFYLANALMLFVYLIVKRFCMLFMHWLCKGESSLFLAVAGILYEYDEEDGQWNLKNYFGQARRMLKVFYISVVVLGAFAVLLTSHFYYSGLLSTPFYPAFGVIVLGEICFLFDGLLKKERKREDGQDEEEAEQEDDCDYSAMRDILRKLLPDKLNAENTTISSAEVPVLDNEILFEELAASDQVAEEAYGRYMQALVDAGKEIDQNFLISGRKLLNGESVLFNNPFYYDLIPYVFYPMNRTLLRHKKVLIILGRHGIEDNIIQWCRDGIGAVTHIPDMWNIGVLSDEVHDVDIGIITRSTVHDLQLHEKNRAFFDNTEFVILIEPSRLLTTAQIGLNSIVRHCRRKEKQLVFSSMDKNCDGLLDALSHVLMTSLDEVTAMNHHVGASSYMIWEADNDHVQHRMLPNLSRYLGMGTELSFAALKNSVANTQWYGGEAFPVVDMHWIVKQYYYDLLSYAGLPTTQQVMDTSFLVAHDMWNAKRGKNQYITVEDESYNMFEVKRAFSTRATEQGFINVIASEYLLKDYMASNDSIFNADPKAIPYITADNARTPRNVALRLCLRMSVGLVSEEELRRELLLIDRQTKEPDRSLWEVICDTCSQLGVVGEDLDGNKLLHCTTADGEMQFAASVIQRKRRFSMDSGQMENMYTITDERFIRLVLGALRSVEYIAEDDNGDRQYLGTELQGQVFQKHLPGQFFTFSGKYYEMLRVSSEGHVLLRRAADHINGRPFYRQERSYKLSRAVDSPIMGHVRDLGDLSIVRQYADFSVQTPGYWIMDRYNDFGTARKMAINGIPERTYNNKAILRIDLKPDGELKQETVQTLTLLFNEVLRTLLAENQDFLVAVTAGEIKAPLTYSLEGAEGFELSPNSIYILEDSLMDIGLLDAVERNIDRIFSIVCDYLNWHAETLDASLNPPPPPPEVDYTTPESDGDGQDGQPEQPPKKRGFFGRIFDFFKKIFRAIGNFFKKIFGGIANFFRKLFRRKPKDQPVEEPEQPVGETPVEGEGVTPEPVPEGTEPQPEPEGEAQPEAENEAQPEAEGEAQPAEEWEDPAEAAPAEEWEDPAEAAPAEEWEDPAENTADDAEDPLMSMRLSSTNGKMPQVLAEGPSEADAPMEGTVDEESNDVVEYEPEQVLKPAAVQIERKPYHERYYLRYGSDEVSAWLDAAGVAALLEGLGYANGSLYQARKGKDIADMVERSFVPNRSGTSYCDFCGCELTGTDYDVLSDGRERCSDCSKTAVKSLNEFVELHNAVLRNMKLFFGVRIDAQVRVQMVNSKKLHKKLGKTFVPTGNHDGRVLGVAIRDRNGYSILIENGAPRLQSTMTMVHEMTHIWQYLNWDGDRIAKTYGDLQLEVYEGMAQWVEIQYAYLINEVAAAKREEIITRSRDDEYGRGFLKFAAKYPLQMSTGNGTPTPFENKKKPL